MTEPAPPAPPPPCAHAARVDGVCQACGHCLHELVLNGACFFCGETELDPVAMSPKAVDPALVPADRLRKRPPRE